MEHIFWNIWKMLKQGKDTPDKILIPYQAGDEHVPSIKKKGIS